MHVLRMAIGEIREHKLNFSLGLLSVVVAAGCVGGLTTVLRAHDLRSQEILAAKEAEVTHTIALRNRTSIQRPPERWCVDGAGRGSAG